MRSYHGWKINKKLQEKRNYFEQFSFLGYKRQFWENNGVQAVAFKTKYDYSSNRELSYTLTFNLFAYQYNYFNNSWRNKKIPALIIGGEEHIRNEEIDKFSNFLKKQTSGSYTINNYEFYYNHKSQLGFRYVDSKKEAERYKSYPAQERRAHAKESSKRRKLEKFLFDSESAEKLKEYVEAIAQLQAGNIELD